MAIEMKPVMKSAMPVKPAEGKKKGGMMVGKAIVAIIVVALAASTIYLYQQNKKLSQDPQKVAAEETSALVAKVGQLIVLPEGETPTVATVNDPEKLKTQPFFANAQAGFKVLIYTNAKKAILYDPVNHKIVEVAPLNIGPTAESSTTTTTTTTESGQ